MIRRTLLVAVASATVLGVAPALGQAGPEQPDPAKAYYQPQGVTVGSFRIFPLLTLSSYYTSNVFNRDILEATDWIYSIAPELKIQSDWNRHQLRFVADANIESYRHFSSEDRTDWRVRADGRLDVMQPLRVFLNAGYEVRHEDRGSPDEINGIAEPTEYARTPISVRLDYQGSKIGVLAKLDYLELNYFSTPLIGGGTVDNDDRDRAEWTGLLRLRYEISPGYGVFVSGSYEDRVYDITLDRNGQNRNTKAYYADAGVSFELTRLLVGEAFLGYSSFSLEDPSFEDGSGFDYGISLTWYPTELTTVRLEGRQTFEASTLLDVSGVDEMALSLSVDHELLRNLILSARGEYVGQDFDGIERFDNIYRATLGAEYLFRRYLALGLRYDYDTRESDDEFSDFSTHEAGLYLKLRV